MNSHLRVFQSRDLTGTAESAWGPYPTMYINLFSLKIFLKQEPYRAG